MPAAQEKKFGKASRHVPHHTQKAKKWYPAEDEVQNKKVGLILNTQSLLSALLYAEDWIFCVGHGGHTPA